MASAPFCFLYDSDALIQILLCEQHNLFRILNQDFGVRSYLLNEVDIEIRSNQKFGNVLKPKLERVLKSQKLSLLSAAQLESEQESNQPVSLAEIRSLGAEYGLDVGIGESVTHAAGHLLGWPVVSNDINAVRTLETKGKHLPPTVLRSFDLFAFGHREGYLNANEVELIRAELLRYREWIPKCMKNQSFVNGMPLFDIRLLTGLSLAASSAGWSCPLYLPRNNAQDVY